MILFSKQKTRPYVFQFLISQTKIL